ncbi:MAG: hypothetical protein WC819_03720 [Parcubacteria group bacterium]|jgi:hypothetical protein
MDIEMHEGFGLTFLNFESDGDLRVFLKNTLEPVVDPEKMDLLRRHIDLIAPETFIFFNTEYFNKNIKQLL